MNQNQSSEQVLFHVIVSVEISRFISTWLDDLFHVLCVLIVNGNVTIADLLCHQLQAEDDRFFQRRQRLAGILTVWVLGNGDHQRLPPVSICGPLDSEKFRRSKYQYQIRWLQVITYHGPVVRTLGLDLGQRLGEFLLHLNPKVVTILNFRDEDTDTKFDLVEELPLLL